MVAANSINQSTAGISGFTSTAFVGTPVTQYNLITGAATSSAVNNVAPSATSGVPIISQGAASQPTFGTAVVAGGGTGNTTFTAYSVIGAGTTATGAFQSIGPGNSGEVLTSQGNASPPIFAPAGGAGSLVFIQAQTASASSTISFTTGTTTYNSYLFVWENVLPGTDNVALQLLVSTNGGSSYLGSGYKSGQWDYSYNSTSITNRNSSSFIMTAGGTLDNTASNGTCNGHIWFHNINGSNQVAWEGQCNYYNFNTFVSTHSFFGGQVTTGVNAYRWQMSSGNIATGTFRLYGLAGS